VKRDNTVEPFGADVLREQDGITVKPPHKPVTQRTDQNAVIVDAERTPEGAQP
jgi:hypothetical protein